MLNAPEDDHQQQEAEEHHCSDEQGQLAREHMAEVVEDRGVATDQHSQPGSAGRGGHDLAADLCSKSVVEASWGEPSGYTSALAPAQDAHSEEPDQRRGQRERGEHREPHREG
jgi:hypothetical protein